MYKVSVIIPTYNAQAHKLSRSVTSALGQSYANMEIIVVDDGSSKAFSGLDSLMEFKGKPITWHRLEENSGVAFARNRGADLAQGDFLAFLDAGDWWDSEKLKEQIAAIKSSDNVGLVYTSSMIHDARGVRLLEASVGENAYLQLLVSQPISGSASSVVIPKDVFKNIGGFFEKYDIPEDRDLWLRVAKQHNVLPVKKTLVHLEVDQNGRSMDPNKKRITYKRFLERHRVAIQENGLWNLANYQFHRGLAGKYMRNNNYIETFRHGLLAVMFWCFNLLKI